MPLDRVQALAAGATIITPNRRLALFIKSEYDAAQVRDGKSVWPSADVLPYGAFLERTWQDIAFAGPGAPGEQGALLLSPQQEIALWETVVESSRFAGILLNPSAAARSARDAWLAQHAFCMDHVRHRPAWEAVNDDAAAYLEWRKVYAERLRTAHWIDSAQLPQAIADALKVGAKSAGAQPRVRHLLRAGYDDYTPQQQLLFDALVASGCVIEASPVVNRASPKVASRVACDDSEAEFKTVAARVRELLVAHGDALPRLNIGVVVPELSACRAAVIRVFEDALEPLRVTTPGVTAPRLFNCSLGLPLTSYPVVFIGLFILKLAGGELTLNEVGALLRSPFVGGAESEFAERALADGELRARGRKRVTPGALLLAAQRHAPRLAALLEKWINSARAARGLRQPPSAWSASLLSLLKGMGWPGERTLDSAEFQTFEKFRDVISGLSALDPLRPRLTLAEVLSVLRRQASDTVFQPEANDAPVQILGTLESMGLSFDALFVTGLAGEAWPAAPRPNPFLPMALQRALDVPHAAAQWELNFARRMTNAWRIAAPAVTFTWPRRDGERALTMSPLIDDVPVGLEPATPLRLLRDALFEAHRVETLDDWRAPALASPVLVGGGTQLFQNQAACPFRAYAIHRLGASALEDGADGLDPRERGSLVHQALSVLWRDISSQAALLALDDAALAQKTRTAVDAAVDALCRTRPDIMTDAFAALERSRLTALLLRLAALEKSRAPFEVVACEQQRAIEIGGVQLNARLDRVDALADGSHVILDYKTGLAHIGAWLSERPDEPQLPLYAVSGDAEADVSGVAFVQLRAREVAFKGLTREDKVLPEVATLAASKTLAVQYAGWPALLDSWRSVLEQLARDYLAGQAAVAPKRFPQTCEYCALGALCRVRELTERAAADDGDAVDNP
jgi:probable DNA repair protein